MKIRIEVEGNKEDVRAFLKACQHIQACCIAGASREISLHVDGDGSANLSFSGLDEDGYVDFTQLPNYDTIDLEKSKTNYYIGE